MNNDKKNQNNEKENKLTNAELAHEHAHDAMHCLVYGNFKAAIEEFTKAIELNPNNADLYYHRGCAYKKLKQYGLAFKNIQIAAEMNPSYHLYHITLEELKEYKK